MREYPYYCFERFTDSRHYEGRFWNAEGGQIAIVACVTMGIDWEAYIGTDDPNSYKEIDTCKWAARYGCRLSRQDAKHFFPDIKLPYRG